jgi:ectoine hydroxylase-related dioxygenase (phytanoyl-CoA dioxygenase family)
LVTGNDIENNDRSAGRSKRRSTVQEHERRCMMSEALQLGFGLVQAFLPEETLRELDETFPEMQHAGTRNLLGNQRVRELAASPAMLAVLDPVLGNGAFAVRATLFNKSPGANWKVSWHQDAVISVQKRIDVAGWGPWSLKDGVHHVRPPADVMERMLAVRIHLDDCGEENGPLRVIPDSHSHGLLNDEQILKWPKDDSVCLTCRRGDAILMRPLVLHASSAATAPHNRRVIHIEFAATELRDGVEWHERVPVR